VEGRSGWGDAATLQTFLIPTVLGPFPGRPSIPCDPHCSVWSRFGYSSWPFQHGGPVIAYIGWRRWQRGVFTGGGLAEEICRSDGSYPSTPTTGTVLWVASCRSRFTKWRDAGLWRIRDAHSLDCIPPGGWLLGISNQRMGIWDHETSRR